jgi:hypothetical protein
MLCLGSGCVLRIQDDPDVLETRGQLRREAPVSHCVSESLFASDDQQTLPWVVGAAGGVATPAISPRSIQEPEQQTLRLGSKSLDPIEEETSSLEPTQERGGVLSR